MTLNVSKAQRNIKKFTFYTTRFRNEPGETLNCIESTKEDQGSFVKFNRYEPGETVAIRKHRKTELAEGIQDI